MKLKDVAVDCICRIACISCPTVYRKLTSLIPSTAQAYCLEFDTRFRAIEGFIFYNYTDPLHIPPDMKNSFDVVLADPPFLSEECLSKVAVTIQYLMKEKVILCTGESKCIMLLEVHISGYDCSK